MRAAPPPGDDPDLARILRAFAASASYFGTGIWLCGAVGAVVVLGGAARGLWWLSGFGAVFFGALVWLMWWSRTKSLDPARSPLLRAVFDEPAAIVEVRHRTASSSSGAFATHWLQLRTRTGDQRGIKVEPADVVALAQALARRCPAADVEVPGFSRRIEHLAVR